MSHFVRVSQKYSAEKGNNNTAEFSKSVVFTRKQIVSNKVKVITGSVIGKVELLHQSFTEYSPDLKRYKK